MKLPKKKITHKKLMSQLDTVDEDDNENNQSMSMFDFQPLPSESMLVEWSDMTSDQRKPLLKGVGWTEEKFMTCYYNPTPKPVTNII
jgi:hypothetical protein